ncbi:cyp2k1: Cytochrome protein [Crotalus adamanteus]|uniref:Cyp2k1: Cytochrome protein n=1 Tax=Crotalus adamanteus TaxID=8729 RepID=A0AAW1CAG5_CROAD
MDLKRPYRTMIELSKEYGPILRIRLGFQEMVVVIRYEMVKEALVNQADVFAERVFIPLYEDLYKGFAAAASHQGPFGKWRNIKFTAGFSLSLGILRALSSSPPIANPRTRGLSISGAAMKLKVILKVTGMPPATDLSN